MANTIEFLSRWVWGHSLCSVNWAIVAKFAKSGRDFCLQSSEFLLSVTFQCHFLPHLFFKKNISVFFIWYIIIVSGVWNMTFQYMSVMCNNQIRVIRIFRTSNMYPFLVLEKLKILSATVSKIFNTLSWTVIMHCALCSRLSEVIYLTPASFFLFLIKTRKEMTFPFHSVHT